LDTTVWVHTHPRAIAGEKETGEEKKKLETEKREKRKIKG
jgi:hypothetical protein